MAFGKAKQDLGRISLITLAACLMYAISAGIRGNYGIMLGSIVESAGISYSSVSFVLAIAQLVFGIMQPVFGIVALKKSNAYVMGLGVFLIAAGLLMIPFSKSVVMLLLFLGVLLPAGTGALCFGIIMSAVAAKLPEGKVSTVSGIVTASSGIGNALLSPAIQALIASIGLLGAMVFLSVPTLLMLPLILMFRGKAPDSHGNGDAPAGANTPEFRVSSLIREASHSKTYLFLMAGFFTCGFHMAIIETHLYSQFISYGLSDQVAAYAFSIYGITIMAGSILSGVVCGKVKMNMVLGSLYALRVLIVALFFIVPRTASWVIVLAALLGLTGASTVIPTAGIVRKAFGIEKLATLFGFVFLCHQIGSFLSAWLGGICVEATGTYLSIWAVDIVLCVMGALVSYTIPEENPLKARGA